MAADHRAICRGPSAAISESPATRTPGSRRWYRFRRLHPFRTFGDEVIEHLQGAHHLAVGDLQADSAQRNRHMEVDHVLITHVGGDSRRSQFALGKFGFSHGVELTNRDEFIGHAGEKG